MYKLGAYLLVKKSRNFVWKSSWSNFLIQKRHPDIMDNLKRHSSLPVNVQNGTFKISWPLAHVSSFQSPEEHEG